MKKYFILVYLLFNISINCAELEDGFVHIASGSVTKQQVQALIDGLQSKFYHELGKLKESSLSPEEYEKKLEEIKEQFSAKLDTIQKEIESIMEKRLAASEERLNQLELEKSAKSSSNFLNCFRRCGRSKEV